MILIDHTTCYAAPRSTASLRQVYNVWRSRCALAALDDAALNDIGLTRVNAQSEAGRPFWDVPKTWRM
jgi:uncharacterized protein YjiS (DUF1127 family)